MNIFEDVVYVNKEAGAKTIDSFKKNWVIIFTGFVYTLLNVIISSVIRSLFIGPLYILSGIVVAIITSAMISNYLYLLFNIINYNRINIDDFKNGFSYFLRKIYGILFIGYVASLLGSFIPQIFGRIYFVLYIGMMILLNPLPETIYLKYYDSWESILKTVDFIKENWVNWFIPNVIFIILIYMVTGIGFINLFNTHIPLSLRLGPGRLVMYLIGQIIFSFMMIYRGHLYKLLSGSSRRKRMFMSKFE